MRGLGICPTAPRHARACPGYPRRERGRVCQNSNAFLGARRRYRLEPALHVPAWMAGTSPAMTEPSAFSKPIPAFAGMTRWTPRLRRTGLSSQKRLHAGAREFVGALVHLVAGVALHPAPVDLVTLPSPRRAGARGLRSSPASGRRCASRCFFQPNIQPVTPCRRYCESVCRSTSQARFNASSAEIAAVSSMRLLVVSGSPPQSSFSRVAEAQDRAPAAGARIAGAGAVGPDLDSAQARQP